MAGTLVKQEVIGSAELRVLMREMKWNQREALGCLVLLWNGSQNRKLTRVTAKMIGEWCLLDTQEECVRLVEALCIETVGFVKRKSLTTFEIVGNRKQVTKLKQLTALRRAGGSTTRSKTGKRKPEANPTLDAEVKLDPIPFPSLPYSSIPFTSIPCPSTPDEKQESLPLGGSGIASGEDPIDPKNSLTQSIWKMDRAGQFTEEEFTRFATFIKGGKDRVQKILEQGRAMLRSSAAMEAAHV